MSTLNYWIDGTDKLWIKVPTIAAGVTTTIYVKKETGFTPNGDNVFDFFDDFSSATIDTTKWNILGTYSYTAGTLTVGVGGSASDNVIASKGVYFSDGYIAEGNIRHVNDGAYGGFGFGAWHDPSPQIGTTYTGVNTMTGWTTSDVIHRNNNVDTGTARVLNLQIGDFARFKVVRKSATEFEVTNGLGTMVTTTGTMYSPLPVAINTYNNTSQIQATLVFVRKYAATEPTITVTDTGNYYEVAIDNTSGGLLEDYQISTDATGFTSLTNDESLIITTSKAKISGVATLNGSVLSGATIRVFNQTKNIYITQTTTNVSGEYVFYGLNEDDFYMVFGEYKDGLDVTYNAFCYPYVKAVEDES